jgi:diguanylate cyclase (GGDEF)-like protein
MRRRSDLLAVAVPVLVVALFFPAVRDPQGGPHDARAVDDLTQLAAALIAAVACAWTAHRHRAGARRPWVLLAAATGSWAAGQAVWSWYELVVDHETPFPSAADAGYLMFSVIAVVGLLSWPAAARGRARWRGAIDGVQVAASLLIISWVTALGAVVRGGGSTWFDFAVSLAYPVLDLVLLTFAFSVLVRGRDYWRSGLALLGCGLISLCVADSGFAYLSASGRYQTGSPVDAGWVFGFLLIAGAAWLARPLTTDGRHAPDSVRTTIAAPLTPPRTTVGLFAPYVPAAAGLATAVVGEWIRPRDRFVVVVAGIVVTTLLVRQLLATIDNRRLVEELVAAQGELHYRAFHDPLTGLANRALFDDHLRHGLELHRRDLRPLTLLYCDLDDFKTVNDSLGHDAGDEVIKIAAERLRAATRAADTVARIGGDEFAVLIEDDGDPVGAASRIFEAFAQPAVVNRRTIYIGGTVGIVELAPGAPPISAAEFLRRADAAMYEAKRSRKGSAAIWTGTPVGASGAAPVESSAPEVGSNPR